MVFLAVSQLPGTGLREVDALVGFVAGMLPLAVLAALLALGRLSFWELLVILVLALGLAALFAFEGRFALAAPFKAAAALALGRMLGDQVLERWWLVLMVLVALLVDAWSVFAGPTRAVVESAPSVLDYLLVHFPALGHAGPATGIGMSDFVFVGLLAAGAARTRLPPRVALVAMLLSFALTLTAGILLRRPLPALPFLGLAFLVVVASAYLRERGQGRAAG